MALIHDLETLNNLERIIPESEGEKIKAISREAIQFYSRLEKEFFELTPQDFYNGKLLDRVIKGETTFSKELRDMGSAKFKGYGNLFYSMNLFNYNFNMIDFEGQVISETAILDRIIANLYKTN